MLYMALAGRRIASADSEDSFCAPPRGVERTFTLSGAQKMGGKSIEITAISLRAAWPSCRR